ncbi:MAG: acyltransferase [Prevotella sp.]|nr:acyltransferase [Prevotella sp.]
MGETVSNRYEPVDFLKGFSIFTIVLMHLLQPHSQGFLNKSMAFGGAGVHVFILCSGFGLYLSWLRKPLGYVAFLKRRFMRVYVPYILVILVSAVIPSYYQQPDKWGAMMSHLFLFKMFFPEWENSFGGQMWFVSTIIQFYISWPLLLRLFNKRGGVIYSLLISLAWATTVAALGKSDVRVWNSFFLQYLWEFVLGMYLAGVFKRHPEKLVLPEWWKLLTVGLIGMLLTGMAGFMGGAWKVFNDIPSLFAYMSVALLVYKSRVLNRFFIFTNKFSYEWYLIHILVFACVFHLFGDVSNRHLLFKLMTALVTSYIIAYLYNLLNDGWKRIWGKHFKISS